MYSIRATLLGTTSILQHAFGATQLGTLQEATKKQTGTPDYSLEWLQSIYVTEDGYLYQPAAHLEGALQRAAGSFKIKGKGGKTWRESFKAYVYVMPEKIPHYYQGQPVRAPGPELLKHPTAHFWVNISRVVIRGAAVARARLEIGPDWELSVNLHIHDEQVRPEVVQAVLVEAGKAFGIGDWRPRHGRFEVERFEVNTSSGPLLEAVAAG